MDISPAETSPVYDAIGQTYTRSRRADSRIADELARLLDLPEGSLVADIGAGTGNYTRALADRGFNMIAVEPSPVMRAQATVHERVAWLEGVAELIPIADNGVGGVVSTLALHHFADLAQAFREMARVVGSDPIVLFTFDTAVIETLSLWMRDYWPAFFADARRTFPPLSDVARLAEEATGRTAEIASFPLPPDLTDLMLASGWRRPEIYLDAEVRASPRSRSATLTPLPKEWNDFGATSKAVLGRISTAPSASGRRSMRAIAFSCYCPMREYKPPDHEDSSRV